MRERGDQQIAEVLALLQHDADQPAQVNGGSASACERSARSRTASPLQTSARRISSTGTGGSASGARGSRIEDDLAFGVGAGQQPGGAVVEQQDDRAGAGDREQMPPAQAQRARPHAGVLRPGRQGGGGGHGLARAQAELVGVQFQAVIARRHHHRQQPRMDRTATGASPALDMPAPDAPPPPPACATVAGVRLFPNGPGVCPSDISTSEPF